MARQRRANRVPAKHEPYQYPTRFGSHSSMIDEEKTDEIKAICKNCIFLETTIGIIITSGGIGKNELSIKASNAKIYLAYLCPAQIIHLSYSFLIIF